MKKSIKIAVTGGPCAGKSSALDMLKTFFEQNGYKVLIVAETATEMMNGGITPQNVPTEIFQTRLLRLQLEKEDLFLHAAEHLKEEKVAFLFDRGAVDGLAYIDEETGKKVLAQNSQTHENLLSRYDAVIHLETAAKLKKEAYSFDNNPTRFEEADGAIALDDRLLKLWETHPKRIFIPASERFEDKCQALLSAAKDLL